MIGAGIASILAFIAGCTVPPTVGRAAPTSWLWLEKRAATAELSKAGRDNLRIGSENEPLNANGWRIAGLRSYKVGRYGFYCHHTNGSVDATFSSEAPDVNGGTMIGGDFLLWQGDNFVVGNAIDNVFYGPMS